MDIHELARSDAKLKASRQGVEKFRNNKFGISVHWGPYTMIGKGEWVLFEEKIDMKKYEKMASEFNPKEFDAEKWVRTFCDAGARMMLITAKHHDGFCMYDSSFTDYKITNTPFGRDPLKELSEACAMHGMDLHFYYSLLDWHHPDYIHNWPEYVKYYHAQVRELCANYGKISGILFDGFWPNAVHVRENPDHKHFNPGGDFEFGKLFDMIHAMQPGCVVTNNTHIIPMAGEDYQVFEQDCPGENKTGFNTTETTGLPLASWFTINDSWAYRKSDRNYKSVGKIIRMMLKLSGIGANMFLNVGPDDLGRIVEEEKAILKEIGEWFSVNGNAIYGTESVKEGNYPWGYVVKKDDSYYAYVIDYPGKEIEINGLPITPQTIKTSDGERLNFSVSGSRIIIGFPYRPYNVAGMIIELK